VKKFCIIVNCFKDKDLSLTKSIKKKIEDSKGQCTIVTVGQQTDKEHIDYGKNILGDESKIECAIVVGGDGTILQAAKDLYGLDIPIIGINLGNVGFLAEVEVDKVDEALEKLINDDYSTQERILLNGKIIRDNNVICFDTALNDIVVSRFGLSRVMAMEVYVNDELINTYNGDGMIVSTPTGTTGYNLSAGGPIAKPDANLLMITPICVHSLYNRSVVVSASDKIDIKIVEKRHNQPEEAMVTFDGRAGFKIGANDLIQIKKSDKIIKLIKLEDKKFFDIVREKIERK
jgi:NAD+ kinase